MRATQLTIGLLFFMLTLHAEVTVRGIVTYQNTGEKMQAIQITARGASPTISRSTSNKEGAFVLTFPTAKIGDEVHLELGIPVYDLVNDKRELHIVLTDKADFRIRLVLCKKGERDANAVKYYSINLTYLEKKHQKEIKKLDDVITTLQKQLTQTDGNTDALNQQIYKLQLEKNKLDDQLEAQKQNAFKLAEEFSRIDLAQADAIYQKAFEAFKQGDIDNARQILNSKEAKQEEADLKKLNAAIQKSESHVQKAKDSITRAEQKILIAKAQRDSLTTSISRKKMLDGQLAELQSKFDEAEQLYTEGVNLNDKNIDHLMILGKFLRDQNKPNQAIIYFEKALLTTTNKSIRAKLLNNLGVVYATIQKIAEAEKYHLQGFYLAKQLAQTDSAQFQPDLVGIAMNLGEFFFGTGKNPESEKYYLYAFSIAENLIKDKPTRDLEADLAMTCLNMGILYWQIQKPVEAETYLLKALAIYKKLAQQKPNQFESYFALTAMNLGGFYVDVKKMSEGEQNLLLALEIYTQLVKINPARYEHYLGKTAMNTGVFYWRTRKMFEAEKYFLLSLDIYKRLAKNSPKQFEIDLALLLTNVGSYWLSTQQFYKAHEALKQTLNTQVAYLLQRQMYQQSSFEYVIDKMAALRDSFEAHHNYTAVITIQQERALSKEKLIVIDTLYANQSAEEYGNLSWYQLIAQQYADSEKAAKRGISLNPAQTWIKTNLAHALLFQNKDAAAQKVYDDLKTQKDAEGKSYRLILNEDFDSLEQAGLPKALLDKARQWVKD